MIYTHRINGKKNFWKLYCECWKHNFHHRWNALVTKPRDKYPPEKEWFHELKVTLAKHFFMRLNRLKD